MLSPRHEGALNKRGDLQLRIINRQRIAVVATLHALGAYIFSPASSARRK
jgi:hypothetical protein